MTIERIKTNVKYITPDIYALSPDSYGDDDLFVVSYHHDFYINRGNISRCGYENAETELRKFDGDMTCQ